mgnify:CR=1 FL=1
MSKPARVRLQAYLPLGIAELIKRKAAKAERPETWEVLRLIKVGLIADGESLEEVTE